MSSLEGKGRVWVFDSKLKNFGFLKPAKGSPYPAARSYQASTSTDYPHIHVTSPSGPPAGSVASALSKDPRSGSQDQTVSPLGVSSSGFDDHGTMLYMEAVLLQVELQMFRLST